MRSCRLRSITYYTLHDTLCVCSGINFLRLQLEMRCLWSFHFCVPFCLVCANHFSVWDGCARAIFFFIFLCLPIWCTAREKFQWEKIISRCDRAVISCNFISATFDVVRCLSVTFIKWCAMHRDIHSMKYWNMWFDYAPASLEWYHIFELCVEHILHCQNNQIEHKPMLIRSPLTRSGRECFASHMIHVHCSVFLCHHWFSICCFSKIFHESRVPLDSWSDYQRIVLPLHSGFFFFFVHPALSFAHIVACLFRIQSNFWRFELTVVGVWQCAHFYFIAAASIIWYPFWKWLKTNPRCVQQHFTFANTW